MARFPAAMLALLMLALAGCSGNAASDSRADPPGPMGIEGSY